MKATIIGAGSTYTPELLEGLIRHRKEVSLKEVCMMDTNPERLNILADLAERMVRAQGVPLKVTRTTRLPQAVSGADFVLSQFRAGGMRARELDTVLCLKRGAIG